MRSLRIAALLLLAPTVGTSSLVAQEALRRDARPSFEVTSVRRNTSADRDMTVQVDPGGRLRVVSAPLLWLIASAYGNDRGGLRPEQIIGAPGWLQSERYDVTAQVADADSAGRKATTFVALRPHLQSLLEDRFRLAVHRDTRDLPIYALVQARPGALGPRFSPVPVDCTSDEARCTFEGGFVGRIQSDALTSEQLMQLLATATGRVVVDRTGLTGPYAINLEWSQDQSSSDLPSVFTAAQEQLGLKLESTRGPVDVIVIDRVERPTPD